jgi:DNA-binding NarL/FixJ family response regulator
LVVEDEELYRDLLAKLCREGGHTVVGQAADGIEAIALIKSKRPDMVLLDLELPKVDGFTVIDRVRAEDPGSRVKILAISSKCTIYGVYRLERARVDGFIDKGTGALATLKIALQRAAVGDCYFADSYYAARRERETVGRYFDLIMSDKQLRVLGMMAKLCSDEEIARRMGIALCMVERHRSNIGKKIGITTRLEMVRWAVQVGIRDDVELPHEWRGSPVGE